MVAQYLYVLAEGAGLETSDLIQLYWQVTTDSLGRNHRICQAGRDPQGPLRPTPGSWSLHPNDLVVLFGFFSLSV